MDLSGASELYILERGRVPLVLAPDSAGTPIVIHPQPFLFRTAYIGTGDLEERFASARATLASKDCFLLAPFDCPDGPPYRSCFLFAFLRALNGMSWQDGPMIYHGGRMLQYGPVTAQGPWTWLDDARMGRYGYFLTGTVGEDSLWRLFRLETDAFQHSVFTLVPIRLAAGCPEADFSSVSIPLLAQELAAQYGDLCRSVRSHSYRDVVTKARNIVEGLVWGRLGAAGGRDLFADLRTVKSLIENQRDSCGWTELEYHLAHKIRLVHARTHATQTAKAGRPLTPEFALSVAEDLIELFRSWGYCKH